ncbi:MAG: PQQ-binding-like beta-propeller repeat protein [Planctomycetes bacterium]|nr:PQQ-binding-like beta-propeller repeat protein [Planctomycetota bacterium]
MINFYRTLRAIGLLLVFIGCCIGFNHAAFADHLSALREAKMGGGFIVHVGCGDGKLTAQLKLSESYSVHGLDTAPSAVEKARILFQEVNHGGGLVASPFDGKHLPYIDNMVNMLFCSKSYQLSDEEIKRVLVPRGKAYIQESGSYRIITKSWPSDYDEWTHYLYGPDNNAVSKDKAVKPPISHLQWRGSPRFSRHHDKSATHLAGLVSARGKIFYILDNGPRASVMWPAQVQLVARDAFNGVILWKKEIKEWINHLSYGVKEGPSDPPRRLVAMGDAVYVTLGLKAAVSKLDAATGKVLKTYSGTEKTEEIIMKDGILYLVANPSVAATPGKKKIWGAGPLQRIEPKLVMAVNEVDGKVLWKKELSWIAPNTLTVGKDVYLCNGPHVMAFDAVKGEKKWTSPELPWRKLMPTYFAPTLVASPGGILYSGGEGFKEHAGSMGEMTCLNVKDGSIKWQVPHLPSGYQSPQDIFVIKGRAWCGSLNSKPGEFDKRYPEVAPSTGDFVGYNIESGAPDKGVRGNDDSYWFHHRCHRAKATEDYFLTSRTGIEMIDTEDGEWSLHHWIRGACMYGLMPANGLVYAPPHPCACYPESKLSGFNALSGPRATELNEKIRSELPRLFKGPAFTKVSGYGENPVAGPHDWPTFRSNPARDGSTNKGMAHAKVKEKWRTKLGGKLSQPTVAAGKLFVASINQHSVIALDQESGRVQWTYVTGGRVDSAPTYYKGVVIFGSKDGYVYCLDSQSGQLAWRYRAAPYDMHQMVFEQLESLWPVHGAVLVRDGIAFVTAGRSMFLEGGMFMYRMDPLSGKVLSVEKMDKKDPLLASRQKNDVPSRNKVKGEITDYIQMLRMPAGSSDILSSEGEHVFMRSQPFNLEGKRTRIKMLAVGQKSPETHLFAANGMLDDSYWHRSFWSFGGTVEQGPGYANTGLSVPCGKIMVLDSDTLFVYGREQKLWRWTVPTEYRLFAASRSLPKAPLEYRKDHKGNFLLRKHGPHKGKKIPMPRSFKNKWSTPMPIMIRAMVKAGDLVYVAGPEDITNEFKEETSLRQDPNKQDSLDRLKKQSDLYSGSQGSLLWAISAKDGKVQEKMTLDILPVFDGMISAGGKIYFSSVNGEIMCMGGE